jgi:hypothetical protein
MTFHKTPLWSIRKGVVRMAIRRGDYDRHDRFVRVRTSEKIHNPEAYAQAVEFNRKHGIKPNKRLRVFGLEKARDASPYGKHRITLPRLKFMEKEEIS